MEALKLIHFATLVQAPLTGSFHQTQDLLRETLHFQIRSLRFAFRNRALREHVLIPNGRAAIAGFPWLSFALSFTYHRCQFPFVANVSAGFETCLSILLVSDPHRPSERLLCETAWSAFCTKRCGSRIRATVPLPRIVAPDTT